MSLNTFLHEAERVEPIDNASSILLDRRENSAYQREPRRLRNVHDQSEVEQDDPSIIAPQEISRMRIGVEETIDEHHLYIQLHHRAYQIFGIYLAACDQRGERVDARAGHVLEHENTLPRHLLKDNRHCDLGVEREVIANAFGVLPFLEEVHFVADSARELGEYCAQAEHVRIGKEALCPSKNEVGSLYVGRDSSLDARTQHLHYDVHAEIARAMNLTERRRGKWDAMPVGEHVRYRTAVALENHLFDLLDRNGWNTVGERTHGTQVGLRQQVCATGKDLADLHEAGPEFRDRRHEAFRAARMKRF